MTSNPHSKRSAYRTARHQHRSGLRVEMRSPGREKYLPEPRFESVTLAALDEKFRAIDLRTAERQLRPTM